MIRTRIVGSAVALVAVALVLGAVALVVGLQVAVERQVQDRAGASADDVAALVDQGRLADPLPVTGAQIVQVIGGDGTVVAGSANADRLVPLLSEQERADALTGRTVRVPGSRTGVSGRLVVAARAAGPRQDGTVVLAAVPDEAAQDSVRVVRAGLLVAVPVLLLGLGLLLHRVVGSALAPVERMRAAAARFTGQTSDERLPVPAGEDEISRLARTLNDMLDRLAAAGLAQERFVADAAHELRSPLASLRTTTEVAARVDDDPLAHELLGPLERLCSLAEDLLLLARVGGTRPPAAQPVDLGRLARTAVARYQDARVPVTARGTGSATGQPVDLDRVLTNLLDNAVRHATGSVTVTVDGPRFTVADDGPGIPDPDLERVFDRFTRLEEARARDSGGSGLGLPIVRALLARGGGRIGLTPAITGPGLVAEVSLPSSADKGSADKGSADKGPEPDGSGRGPEPDG